MKVPPGIKFLVVDGQHRLRAQEFASFVADYACIIHVGLTEAEMGRLFLEINDTQKRVPASLRWDLVRLVQPAEDKASLRAADLIFELATDTDSPLFLRIDLTGERQKIALKQGSIAPEVKRLVGPKGGLRDQSYEEQSHILRVLFWTLRERDVDGWEDATGPLYKARVIRGLLNVLPDLLDHIKKPIMNMAVNDLLKFLRRVDLATLSDAELKTQHGNAGIAAIRDTIKEQLFR